MKPELRFGAFLALAALILSLAVLCALLAPTTVTTTVTVEAGSLSHPGVQARAPKRASSPALGETAGPGLPQVR